MAALMAAEASTGWAVGLGALNVIQTCFLAWIAQQNRSR